MKMKPITTNKDPRAALYGIENYGMSLHIGVCSNQLSRFFTLIYFNNTLGGSAVMWLKDLKQFKEDV